MPIDTSHRKIFGRKLLTGSALVAVSLVGSATGILLLGHETARIGPVEAELSLRPSLSGGTSVQVPPLGTMRFQTHQGPLALHASVVELRPEVARDLARDPAGFRTLGNRVGDDVRAAMIELVLRASLGALLLTGVVALIAFRSIRAVAVCVSVVMAAGGAAAGTTALTFRTTSLREPTYTGLLASAPTAIGDAQQIAQNFSAYRLALGQLVGNVVDLYDAGQSLPTYSPGKSTIAVLHVSDLHLNPAGVDLIRSLVGKFNVRAVLDTGDLTDHGSAAEIPFATSLGSIGVPYVYVRGNHDSVATVEALAALPHVRVLDDSVTEVAGIRIAGIADPRFTPDKTTRLNPGDQVVASGERLAQTIRLQPGFVTVAMVHDPLSALPLDGLVPLVLAGHRHARSMSVEDGTLRLVQGSTGGAGLRGLEGEKPTPLECSVLYFDAESHRLQAWDDVTVGGLGTASVTVERHLRPSQANFTGPNAKVRPKP